LGEHDTVHVVSSQSMPAPGTTTTQGDYFDTARRFTKQYIESSGVAVGKVVAV
jgi:hypothetical protein